MKLAIGNDHGGLELKKKIITILEELNIEYEDFGTHDQSSTDYSDYGLEVSQSVSNGDYDRGILICGTGIGMSIAANKVRGIRAALVTDIYSAKVTRQHNNSNVLCLGARTTGVEVALEIVRTWLSSEFEGGRHQRRLDKISHYESNC